MDFLTAEVWTPNGLQTQYVLFAIDLKTRSVELAGITPHPTAAFMAQVARNRTDPQDGFIRSHPLICDGDTKFTEHFKDVLEGAGIEVVVTPTWRRTATPSPNASCSRSSPSAWST